MSKFCANCGNPMADDARFCMECGAPVAGVPVAPVTGAPVAGTAAPYANAVQPQYGSNEEWRQNATEEENSLIQGQKVSPNVYLGPDGKYRWVYEMKIIQNGTMLRTLMMCMPIPMLAATVPILLIWVIASGFSPDPEGIRMFLIVWLGITAFLAVVVLISLPIYSAIMKGSYWTIYEMDAEKITQTQMDRTFKRTQALALVLYLTDRDFSDRMMDVRLGTQKSYDSKLRRVRHVRLFPKRDLISVTGPFLYCPVFAQPEDYNFILNYILNYIPQNTRDKFIAKHQR